MVVWCVECLMKVILAQNMTLKKRTDPRRNRLKGEGEGGREERERGFQN